MLRETLDLVKERDPDVIEGHNIQAFDFPYLFERCRRHGIPVDLGRDGSLPRTYPTSMRFAERQVEFEAVEIAGRHVIDTLHQVMAFDVFKRDLPNYTLKGAAKYFGFAPEGRTYVAGRPDRARLGHGPHRLMEYAIDDAIETERLARHLSGARSTSRRWCRCRTGRPRAPVRRPRSRPCSSAATSTRATASPAPSLEPGGRRLHRRVRDRRRRAHRLRRRREPVPVDHAPLRRAAEGRRAGPLPPSPPAAHRPPVRDEGRYARRRRRPRPRRARRPPERVQDRDQLLHARHGRDHRGWAQARRGTSPSETRLQPSTRRR